MKRTTVFTIVISSLIIATLACSMAAPAATPDTQATISAALAATNTAQVGMKATIDAAVQATSAAQVAKQATATPAATPIPPTSYPTYTPYPTSTPLPPTTTLPLPGTLRPPTNTPVPPPPTVTPAQPAAGAAQVREVDGVEMVFIPAGEFIMGSADSDSRASDDEKPQHKVYLDGFWIDKTEVTNAQYKKCVAAGKCTESSYPDDTRLNGDTQPVVGVNWNDARAYCEWAGARLPTEAEWEKTARGGDGRTYPWGNEWDGRRLNFCDANCEYDWKDASVDDGYQYTAPVGSYPAGASPYGALDMAGNVWEWVADWYDSGYYARSPGRNPSGPDSGQFKVVRGGSFIYDFPGARSAYRYVFGLVPAPRSPDVGFRCAQGSPQ
jgi:formylglycine-generating enzyme required for sulfatase activity